LILCDVQEQAQLFERLFAGEDRDLRIASITFGVLRGSVTIQQRNAFRDALHAMDEHIQEGVACVEEGDQRFRQHVQCMLYIRISRAETAADDLKTFLLSKMQESETGRVRLYVLVRDVGGEVTVERQIGYCAKDMGKPHFAVVYMKGITHDVLRSRGAAYAQVRGHNVFHKKTELKPFTMWTVITKFEHGNLYPLCKRMNMFQVVRFMLLSDNYVLAGTWNSPVGGRLALRASDAWRSLLMNKRMYGTVDIYDIVSVLSRGDYGPGSEAYEIMDERSHRFDDMSYEYARRLSRRALQLLEPHLLDGVVVGDVDVDVLLDAVEVDDHEDPMLHDDHVQQDEAFEEEPEAHAEAHDNEGMEEG
jgi:hypothetical protein